MAEFPSSAVAPPNRISLGPMYPGVPSSPTAGTAVSVCPHRQPGPSSFFSITAFTTVYPGAGLGPATPTAGGFGAAAGVPGVPGVDGADDDEVSLPDPEPPALATAAAASESESDSVVMRESTSMPQQQQLAASPRGTLGFGCPEISGTRRRRRQGPPPYDAAGIAGTLDSPGANRAARFARVPLRLARGADHEVGGREREKARRGASAKAGRLSPASGIAVEVGWPLRSGGRGQRAPWRGGGGIRRIRGGQAANLGGAGRPLAWLEWRRRAATGGRGRGGRERRGVGMGKRKEKFSNVLFLVLLGGRFYRSTPRASSISRNGAPAWASCGSCCRITRVRGHASSACLTRCSRARIWCANPMDMSEVRFLE